MKLNHRVFKSVDGGDPKREFVAIIMRGPHLCSFTFGPTYAEADRKGKAAIETFEKPDDAKARRNFPDDTSSISPEPEEAI